MALGNESLFLNRYQLKFGKKKASVVIIPGLIN